ncbi:unnamed protein product [Cladocopium goreaui]|uniref:Amine oxidase domain-containing protein n=1 Tax=Cladocopium goreaui TaxID=2562237 RepID=A0A9P1BSJ2_9DINO|nr:unnamed protein product [Cladocopium goreaui]
MFGASPDQVTLLEATDDVGGHAKTWVETTDQGELPIDIGFIFNNVNYYKYKNFTSYFDYPLHDTALNTSGAFNGRYWDNVHSERGVLGEDLEREVDRFMELVNEPEDTLRYLTPLAAFLWWHGFTDDFYRLCLTSIISVLFVTKMGAARQSAQATLNYFRPDVGFSHMRYQKALVQNNIKGSQFLWRDIIADANSTGLLDIRLNSKVESLQWRGGWDLLLNDGRISTKKFCKRHKETLTSLELASCTVHGLLRNDAFLTLLATQRGVQSCVLRRSLQSLALAEELRTLRPEVYFERASTSLHEDSAEDLRQLAKICRRFSRDLVLFVSGHCGRNAPEFIKLTFTLERATSVCEEVLDLLGVTPAESRLRMYVFGCGSHVAARDVPKGGAANWCKATLRVELHGTEGLLVDWGSKWWQPLEPGEAFPEPQTVSGYEDIILAIPASECSKIVNNPWKKLVLGQIDYVTTFLTLHTDAEATVAQPHFAPAQNSSVLYFVDESTMTGKIGQIFGDHDSELLLTVHSDQNVINPEKVKTQYAWSHHFFSLWELAVARRFVPMFDSSAGIHFAGDWKVGVGHDDAIKAGIAAACRAGIHAELSNEAPAERQLYKNLLLDVCVDATTPLSEEERNPLRSASGV